MACEAASLRGIRSQSADRVPLDRVRPVASVKEVSDAGRQTGKRSAKLSDNWRRRRWWRTGRAYGFSFFDVARRYCKQTKPGEQAKRDGQKTAFHTRSS